MIIIAITPASFFEAEAASITAILRQGKADIVHIRKPASSEEELERLLRAIPSDLLARVTLHDHFTLSERFPVGGLHTNSRNSTVPSGFKGRVSTSCHSIEEVAAKKRQHNYVFLSPIFDSISKKGYHAAFTQEEILKAAKDGIIDKSTIALGGVTFENLPVVERLGFGGGAMSGEFWPDPAQIVTIAGSDSSAGAGIQADIKTAASLKGYAASVITSITAQNTTGVDSILPIPPEIVAAQIKSVLNDLDISAIKIGMVHNSGIVNAIVDTLAGYPPLPIVCDPVMISTSGSRLIEEDTAEIIKRRLFPISTLITPNLHEAEYLYGRSITDEEQIREAARTMGQLYGTSVLIKGGHLSDNENYDTLYILPQNKITTFYGKKIASKNLHGTGCSLSSAIATNIAKGYSLEDAVRLSKEYITRSILRSAHWKLGKGSGPLSHF